MNDILFKGQRVRVRTPHRSDGNYSSSAVMMHDSPPDQELVKVRLLECFYCLSEGDELETQRYLVSPA